MNPVFTFGSKLAVITNQNESACLGLLCLAIKDAGKNPQQMGYQDFKLVIQTHLPARLEKLKIANSDMVIKELLQYLNQKQSIFTMIVH